jgi:hypothetical protein
VIRRIPPLPRTRAEARALGVTRYQPAGPCPNGHAAPRHTASGSCVECVKMRQRAQYHAANPGACYRPRREGRTPCPS